MTEEQRKQLTDLVFKLRMTAKQVGPLHSWWDIIFDIEAFLNGKETFLKMTAEEWINYSTNLLNEEKI